MKLLLCVASFISVAVGFRYADAAETPKVAKPVVCLSYAIAKTDKANDDAVAICYDSKKPQLFYRFEEKDLPGKTEGRVKVLLGWR